mmetsp:Transcript_82206/g.161240  ORF Transcript_82206/g.161240 Transcript_82206/m.161240 type:complete len:259 (+) Transcript_82206:238-1014(+)
MIRSSTSSARGHVGGFWTRATAVLRRIACTRTIRSGRGDAMTRSPTRRSSAHMSGRSRNPTGRRARCGWSMPAPTASTAHTPTRRRRSCIIGTCSRPASVRSTGTDGRLGAIATTAPSRTASMSCGSLSGRTRRGMPSWPSWSGSPGRRAARFARPTRGSQTSCPRASRRRDRRRRERPVRAMGAVKDQGETCFGGRTSQLLLRWLTPPTKAMKALFLVNPCMSIPPCPRRRSRPDRPWQAHRRCRGRARVPWRPTLA